MSLTSKSINLVAKSLDLSPEFRAAYEVYQEIIGAVRKRDASALAAALESYRSLGNRMGQSIKTLKKYKRQVINALHYEYSNGFLEGINGIIKKIKNTAYGYTNWTISSIVYSWNGLGSELRAARQQHNKST